MSSKYELTLVLDTNFSASEIQSCKEGCEKIIGADAIKQIDDIGILNTAYPISGQSQAYYVTYLLELNGDKISEINRELGIVKGIAKSFVYGIDINDEFHTFSNITAKYNELFPQEEETKEVDDDIDIDIDIDDEGMIDAPTQDEE